jgi:galactitol-specific phosphotransferase system IIB component
MAILTTDLTTSLMLKMKVGVDQNQQDVYKTMTLKKVKVTAADQDIYDVALGIAAALKYPVQDIIKSQTRQLISAE